MRRGNNRSRSYVNAVNNAYAKGKRAGFGYNGTVGPEANPYQRSDLRKAWEDGRRDEMLKLQTADEQARTKQAAAPEAK